jgi:hypothetical protein
MDSVVSLLMVDIVGLVAALSIWIASAWSMLQSQHQF